MASNISSDQQRLIVDESENPPTYDEVINPTNAYGTFVGSSSVTTAPFNLYAVGSQQPTVVVVGGCPSCKVGMLDPEFTCPGVCCAICCFPIGILCCLALRQRRCNFCGAIFD